MNDNIDDEPAKAKAPAPKGLDRAEKHRERFRQTQLLNAKKARFGAVGGQPSDNDAARMVAEFHARGGQVTTLPSADNRLEEDEGSRSGRGRG